MQLLYYKGAHKSTHGRWSYPQSCAYCRGALLKGRDNYEQRTRDYEITSRLCPNCGWWDAYSLVIHHAGNDEMESYLGSILTDFARTNKVDFACSVLANELARNPDGIYSLAPRRFEELVASIFRNVLDCSVELTRPTRDGGKDLIGFDGNGGPFIVEVKRNARERKVGVSIVRELLGVLVLEEVHRGFVVTTSKFTRDAKRAAETITERNHLSLELKDINDLVAWLKLGYERYFDLDAVKEQIRYDLQIAMPIDGFPRPDVGMPHNKH